MKKIVMNTEEINAICKRLGQQISHDLRNEERPPLILGVMKGALNFMYDLVKYIDNDVILDFCQLSSYSGTSSTGNVTLKKPLTEDPNGRTVIIVEDIIDTGLSMEFLENYLKENYKIKKVLLCALFDKTIARKNHVKVDYVGRVLNENLFLIGYGLDYCELGRNINYIYAADEEEVARLNAVLKK